VDFKFPTTQPISVEDLPAYAHCDIIIAMQWSSIDWPRLLKLALLGAVGFWLPDVILHALRGYNFNGRDVGIVTTVSPLTLLIAFFVAKLADKANRQKSVIPALIAGVWLFGGLFMLIGASFSGGGFLTPNGARWVMVTILLSVLPMYTFIMATYDGALGALLLVTPVAVAAWIVERSGILLRFGRKEGTHKV
jgi:hypothetical protein